MIGTKEFLSEQKGTIPLILFLTFTFTTLIAIHRDICQSIQSQKKILSMDLLARTDIQTDQAERLLEQLKQIPSLTAVTAVSPEESLKNISADPSLLLDPDWLEKKNSLGGRTILPWSYTLYFDRWDTLFLEKTVPQIRNLTAGEDKIPVFTEVDYDHERWTILNGLSQRLRWLRSLGFVSALLVLTLGMVPMIGFFSAKKEPASTTLSFYFSERRGPLLIVIFFCAAASATLHQSLILFAFGGNLKFDQELFLVQILVAALFTFVSTILRRRQKGRPSND
ncbi:MAG: hypothetical protein HYY63_04130 [Elusimicrobia bacterium]|nr:hypothetical protein [Elusimicrobiota bacterium]